MAFTIFSMRQNNGGFAGMMDLCHNMQVQDGQMMLKSKKDKNKVKFRHSRLDSSYLVNRFLYDKLQECSDYFRGSLLDIGCGNKPYFQYFASSAEEWIGIDYPASPWEHTRADIYADALFLPFKNCAFDTVLCTQVLEHVNRPLRLLKEAYRVLRVNGMLILSAPQYDPLHEVPRDYYRYTKYGLQFLAEEANFTVLEIVPTCGIVGLLGHLICVTFPWVRRNFMGLGIINVMLSRGSWLLDQLVHKRLHTLGYVMVCVKSEKKNEIEAGRQEG